MKIGIGFSNCQLLKKNFGIEQVIDSERKKFPLPHTTKKNIEYTNSPTSHSA
jgi:hypothetical protein